MSLLLFYVRILCTVFSLVHDNVCTWARGVNTTEDTGDASPAIFCQPGIEYLISPKVCHSSIVVFITVNRVLTVHLMWCNG